MDYQLIINGLRWMVKTTDGWIEVIRTKIIHKWDLSDFLRVEQHLHGLYRTIDGLFMDEWWIAMDVNGL